MNAKVFILVGGFMCLQHSTDIMVSINHVYPSFLHVSLEWIVSLMLSINKASLMMNCLHKPSR